MTKDNPVCKLCHKELNPISNWNWDRQYCSSVGVGMLKDNPKRKRLHQIEFSEEYKWSDGSFTRG